MTLQGVLCRIVHGIEGRHNVLYPKEEGVSEGELSVLHPLASSLHSGAVPGQFTLRVWLRSSVLTRSSLDPDGTRYTGWFENRPRTSRIGTRIFKMVVKMYLHQDLSALNHFTWDLYLRPLTLGQFKKVSVFINVQVRTKRGGCTFVMEICTYRANISNTSTLLHSSINTEDLCSVQTRSGGNQNWFLVCVCTKTLEVHTVQSANSHVT